MTTTELIKILKDNEYGGISHKSRELSLTINGKHMPNPQITLSSTGDGICEAEIDLDVEGEFLGEPKPKTERWKEVYAESDGSPSWIEFTCPNCKDQFGIESGEYGWNYGDPIPWKSCPMCGAKVKVE